MANKISKIQTKDLEWFMNAKAKDLGNNEDTTIISDYVTEYVWHIKEDFFDRITYRLKEISVDDNDVEKDYLTENEVIYFIEEYRDFVREILDEENHEIYVSDPVFDEIEYLIRTSCHENPEFHDLYTNLLDWRDRQFIKIYKLSYANFLTEINALFEYYLKINAPVLYSEGFSNGEGQSFLNLQKQIDELLAKYEIKHESAQSLYKAYSPRTGYIKERIFEEFLGTRGPKIEKTKIKNNKPLVICLEKFNCSKSALKSFENAKMSFEKINTNKQPILFEYEMNQGNLKVTIHFKKDLGTGSEWAPE